MGPRIVVLASGLAAHGGIQRYNRSLCKALTDYAVRHAGVVEIVSLHDPPGWFDAQHVARPVIGCAGNRVLFVLRALAALAKPYDCLIVAHVDFGPVVLLPRLLRPRTPVVALTHGIDVWTRLPALKRIALQQATRVCAGSAYTAEKLVSEQGVEHTKITLLPYAVDPEFLAGMAEWEASGSRTLPSRLLTIARLSTGDVDKGIDCTIEALQEVRSQIPDVSFVIIGDGDDRPRLEQLARDCGVDDLVHFAGRIPDTQIHAYLGGTEVLVLPSRKEGFGIVFVEAMIHGKPTIAGAHGGSPEVVLHNETGLLVPHNDRHALALAITELLSDAAKRQAMGEAGRQRARRVYDYGSFRAAVAQLLDALALHGPWSAQQIPDSR